MRYLGLFLFTSVIWLLISAASAAQNSLAAAREGRKAGASSILSGFTFGWTLTGLAFVWDTQELVGSKVPPYGFWVVLVLHAGFGSWVLIYLIYAIVTLRRLESRRNKSGPTR